MSPDATPIQGKHSSRSSRRTSKISVQDATESESEEAKSSRSQIQFPGDVFPHVNQAAVKQTSIGDFMQKNKKKNQDQFNAIINEEVAGHRLEAKNGEQDETIEDDPDKENTDGNTKGEKIPNPNP